MRNIFKRTAVIFLCIIILTSAFVFNTSAAGTIIYFSKGEYLKKTGMVARIDETARILKIVNAKIGFEDIFDIKQE